MKAQLSKLRQNRTIKIISEIGLILLLFFIIQGWLQRDMVQGTPPALSGTLLNGQPFELQSLKGKPVLLHFWATWCGICKLEQDSIEAISRDYTVISVAMKSGNADEVRHYMQDHQLSFLTILDQDGGISQRFGIRGVPASFILDPAGQIAFSQTGYTTSWGLRARLWWAGNLSSVRTDTR